MDSWPQLCAGCAALRLHQVTTGMGVYASRWAILRLGNHKKWGVAGGLGALGIRFLSRVAPDAARSWFRGVVHCADFGVFWRLFGPFLRHTGPFSRHFGIFHEPKPVATGSKWAKTTCLSIINGPRSFLEKRVFDPLLFLKPPIFKAFWDFPWPKTR